MMSEKYPQGKKPDDSSTFEADCDLCSADGELKEAVGYCSQCEEYYCNTCLRVHAKSKASREHTLLDKSAFALLNINEGSDTTDDPERFRFHRDINIKLPNEEKDCLITGMAAVSDRSIVLIDQSNKSVRMLDIIDDAVKGCITFNRTPIGITSLPNAEVAITFPGESLIRMIATTSTLKVKATRPVNGLCTAIDYCNGRIYVSFQKPVKFQILSLSGGPTKTIRPNAPFLQHCSLTLYITVHPNEKTMYISDLKNNTVLNMDMTGVLLSVYTNANLEKPHAISFSQFDSIYLCNREKHVLNKMAGDLSGASVVLTEQDGLEFPITMCFCHSRRFLLISSSSSDPKFRNYIKVYNYN